MAWTCPELVVRWLKFSPSGLLLATTSGESIYTEEGSVHRLWDALSGRELARLDDTDILHSMVFASERQLLFFSEDGCRLWDADSGEVKRVSRDCSAAGGAIPGPKPLAVNMCSKLLIQNLPSGKMRHRLSLPHGTAVYGDDMAVAGGYLAACCRGRGEFHELYVQAALWDIERGKRLRTYEVEVEGHPRWDDWLDVFITLHPDGPRIAVATGKVQAFGIDDEEPLEGFKPFKCKKLCALRYSPDGGALLVLDDGQLTRLDALTGQVLSKFKIPASFQWDRGAIDPNCDKVAVAAGNLIEVLDILDA